MNTKKLNHLAIIMDGNRRWAKERFMPSIFGHKAGFENAIKIARLCNDRNIKYLTLWALSTENLGKRSEEEVTGIIALIKKLGSLVPEFMEMGVKFECIGNTAKLPDDTQEILRSVTEATKNNSQLTLTAALVYGGQDEIIRATQKIIQAGLTPENITPEIFRGYLDTSKLPVPDVIVRTGGDIRHSGFLLYDSAYSEYYFTEKKWPEFDEVELNSVIEFFHGAKRNFGK